jgi:hypothetical protein
VPGLVPGMFVFADCMDLFEVRSMVAAQRIEFTGETLESVAARLAC